MSRTIFASIVILAAAIVMTCRELHRGRCACGRVLTDEPPPHTMTTPCWSCDREARADAMGLTRWGWSEQRARSKSSRLVAPFWSLLPMRKGGRA